MENKLNKTNYTQYDYNPVRKVRYRHKQLFKFPNLDINFNDLNLITTLGLSRPHNNIKLFTSSILMTLKSLKQNLVTTKSKEFISDTGRSQASST